ncbi:uncharacterized protein LOC119222533 [Pungitius pungitius]|uniref:uncharacterized protein LOC119222533 n=1 Tax=Pungitius pungitius TaxID=134920 RepID=UPI002E0EC3C2
MGTKMEVAQLESRMNIEDYRKLRGLFLVSVFFFLVQFIHPFHNTVHLHWKCLSLFCMCVNQQHPHSTRPSGPIRTTSKIRDSVSRRTRPVRPAPCPGRTSSTSPGHRWAEDPRRSAASYLTAWLSSGTSTAWREGDASPGGGLCSFLLLHLSDKVKKSRPPPWKPPRTLTCPHRHPVQKVAALHLTSAQISLFESLRADSDSADIVRWEELVRGKHGSCHTVTHRGGTRPPGLEKVPCLWDVSRQLCVHRLAGVFPETRGGGGGDTQTLLLVHEERGFLLLSFNSRLLLLEEQRKRRGPAATSTL